MDNANTFAVAASAGIIAYGSAVWGKIGWLILLWIFCFTLDYITGSLAAFKNHEWDSEVAHEGLWHKGAMILVVTVAALFDLAIITITRSAGIQLPFNGVFALPVALSWYTITELGSILENAIKMGAEHVPAWLQSGLKIAADAVDKAGENKTGGGKNEQGK